MRYYLLLILIAGCTKLPQQHPIIGTWVQDYIVRDSHVITDTCYNTIEFRANDTYTSVTCDYVWNSEWRFYGDSLVTNKLYWDYKLTRNKLELSREDYTFYYHKN